jgi:hypothetical protein
MNLLLIIVNLELDLVDSFPDLKANDELPHFVNVILSLWSDMSEHQNACLSQFFKKTVCRESADREADFEKLLQLMSFNDEFRLGPLQTVALH